MGQTEQKAFYFVSSILKNEFECEYCVFPQVRLADFVDLTQEAQETRNINRHYFDIALSNITSKSVDFLICLKEKEYSSYLYLPKLVIEIDGVCHREIPDYKSDYTFDRIKRNDKFKDELFVGLGISCCRIQVIESADIQFGKIQTLLHKNLADIKISQQ